MAEVVVAQPFGSRALLEFLMRHPFARVQGGSDSGPACIRFETGRSRAVFQGNPRMDCYGLTELMDNNPLVCADEASVTGPEATLALIALGPLAKANLLKESVAIAFNFPAEGREEIEAALATEGWHGIATVASSEPGSDIYTAECIAEIVNPGSATDIEALYDECYGRSFFVRPACDPTAPTNAATYGFTFDDIGTGSALVKVTVSSGMDGRAGAAGLVHMFNIMCGFEESLGIA